MCRLYLHFFVAIAVVLLSQGNAAEESEHEERIIGGFYAKPGRFPYQVSLRFLRDNGEKPHFCGGTIIGKNHVLTAGHCAKVITDLSRFEVSYGCVSLNDTKHNTYLKIQKVIIHKDFVVSRSKIANDIALLQVKPGFKSYNKRIKTIKLNTKYLKGGVKCVVSGWGRWEIGGPIHPELKGAFLPIVNMKECQKNYSSSEWKVDSVKMICAGHRKGNNNVCQGDSGGPLVCNKKLAGIVSWGRGCATAGYPAVYTNVKAYVKWIKQNGGLRSLDAFDENDSSLVDDDDDDDDDDEVIEESLPLPKVHNTDHGLDNGETDEMYMNLLKQMREWHDIMLS